MENISGEAVDTRETHKTDILNDPWAVLATATRPNETVCNMDDNGDIIQYVTINHHHQEDGASTDGGSISRQHNLIKGAVALHFSPEYHEKHSVVRTIQHQNKCSNLHWIH